jgi:transposase InsO family protein
MFNFDALSSPILRSFRAGLLRREDGEGNAWQGTAADAYLLREAGLVEDSRIPVWQSMPAHMPLGLVLTLPGAALARQMKS